MPRLLQDVYGGVPVPLSPDDDLKRDREKIRFWLRVNVVLMILLGFVLAAWNAVVLWRMLGGTP